MGEPERDLHVDFVGRLKARQGRGHAAESRLIDTILGDLHFATHASVRQLAQAAEVSEPTVTRLARAMGFSHMREMKVHMAQALVIGGAYLRALPKGAPAPSRIVSTVISRAHASLDLIGLASSTLNIAELGRVLGEARQILIYGTGGNSSMAATELQNRLFRLGLHTTAYIDPQLQRMSAAVAEPGTVLVAFSSSGQVRSVRDAVKIGNEYGATTLAVTKPASPLARAAKLVVPFEFQEDGGLLKPSSSRYALLALVDILAMAAAESIGAAAIERLRRVRQSLTSSHILDPKNPVGD